MIDYREQLRKEVMAQFERSFKDDTVAAIVEMILQARVAAREEVALHFESVRPNGTAFNAYKIVEMIRSFKSSESFFPAPQCPRCKSYRLSCRDGHTWNIPTPASSVALAQNTSCCPLVGCSIDHPHVHTIGGPASDRANAAQPRKG